jgi:hypothetical protein
MPIIIRQDVFHPTLIESSSLVLSDEQRRVVREILEVACSDSAFAEKAYESIYYALTQTPTIPPVVTSLEPASAVIGSEPFDIHVKGTGFTPDSAIVFAGQVEPTTFVSETELTTGVNMPLWTGPDIVPVAVRNQDNVQSDPMSFEFTNPAARSSKSVKSVKSDTDGLKPVNDPPTFDSSKKESK